MQLETADQVDFMLDFWPARCRLSLLECLEAAARVRNDLSMLRALAAWRLRAQLAEQAPKEPPEPDRRYPSSIF